MQVYIVHKKLKKRLGLRLVANRQIKRLSTVILVPTCALSVKKPPCTCFQVYHTLIHALLSCVNIIIDYRYNKPPSGGPYTMYNHGIIILDKCMTVI